MYNFLPLLISTLTLSSSVDSTRIVITNSCSYPVWAAANPGGGKHLSPGDTWTLSDLPTGSRGRIWGRTNCAGLGRGGKCESGDCGGLLECATYGRPPNTVAEYSIDKSGFDEFRVSVAEGFNIPIQFRAAEGFTDVCTESAQCVADVNERCPTELRDPGGCNSPCTVFQTEQFCCGRGECDPTSYSKFFEGLCSDAVTYPYDAGAKTRRCQTGIEYSAAFCLAPQDSPAPAAVTPQPKPSHSGGIAVYWGQSANEGNLRETCATGNYKVVNLAFLNTFGSGRTPSLNLGGHCDPSPSGNGCSALAAHIMACQSQGIKVLLSLGGGIGTYSLSSPSDANKVGDYLWNNFLGGRSASRPFGDAILDGIDFDIDTATSRFWDDLARSIATRPTRPLLAAAPQCVFPDANLDAAIATGLFDLVWVQFYNNPSCHYSGGTTDALLRAWNKWVSTAAKQVFIGLPASPRVAPGGGFIPADVLVSRVLPEIKKSAKYGGVMLWSKLFDKGYSAAIKASV